MPRSASRALINPRQKSGQLRWKNSVRNKNPRSAETIEFLSNKITPTTRRSHSKSNPRAPCVLRLTRRSCMIIPHVRNRHGWVHVVGCRGGRNIARAEADLWGCPTRAGCYRQSRWRPACRHPSALHRSPPPCALPAATHGAPSPAPHNRKRADQDDAVLSRKSFAIFIPTPLQGHSCSSQCKLCKACTKTR